MIFVEFQKDSGRKLNGMTIIYTTCDALEATHFIAKLSEEEQKEMKSKKWKRFPLDQLKFCEHA
jgi:hypothetical protein